MSTVSVSSSQPDRRLLLASYDGLSLPERTEALAAARAAGRAAALEYLRTDGPEELDAAHPREYWQWVVAPALARGEIRDMAAASWKARLGGDRALSDPRVTSFLAGWHEAVLTVLNDGDAVATVAAEPSPPSPPPPPPAATEREDAYEFGDQAAVLSTRIGRPKQSVGAVVRLVLPVALGRICPVCAEHTVRLHAPNRFRLLRWLFGERGSVRYCKRCSWKGYALHARSGRRRRSGRRDGG